VERRDDERGRAANDEELAGVGDAERLDAPELDGENDDVIDVIDVIDVDDAEDRNDIDAELSGSELPEGSELVRDFGDEEVVETRSLGANGASDDLLYDCTTWAGESRGLLASMLTSHGITHVWQGTVLSVRPSDESAVDDLIDEVMASARPALDPDAPKVVYEVGGWPAALQSMLADSLTVADLPYEWDEQGDLVVYAEHEEEVEVVLDDLPDPDAPEFAGEVSANDGIAVHELLDRLFLASGKLASKDDSASILAVDEVAATLERMGPPFGFEQPQWKTLVAMSSRLRNALAAGPGDEDALTDSEIRSLSGELKGLLRQYV
jgi:hypothetical protein